MSDDVRSITPEEEEAVLAGLSDRTKLIVAGWVYRNLYDGWRDGGRTYRALLADLGFPSDELTDGEHAYRYLLNTAMEINNALPAYPPPPEHTYPVTELDLRELRRLDEAATPPPWRSMREGRDHWSGDNFIMIGEGDSLGDDLYLHRSTDDGPVPASIEDQDLVAAARTLLGPLLDEVDRLRGIVAGGQSS
jgi:hypothetical protein